jgi:Flp pilus assembly protein TadG
LVEFALILPLLLVLLLGVADFGRVFQAEIVIESASRAAAEAGAIEYLRTQDIREADPGDLAYYQRIHAIASHAACTEARILPNTTYAGGLCSTWPAVVVCVHDADSVDPLCDGTPATGYSDGLPNCTAMSSGWNTTEDSQSHDYVEVRLCYHFSTLFNLHLSLPFSAGISVGDIYIQRTAIFTVADY